MAPLLAGLALSGAGPGSDLEPKPLRIAVYHNFAPFSRRSEGIDVDLARRLAAQLGRPAEIIWYYPGESVEDDVRYALLRNLRADVMMHVPVDPRIADRFPQATALAPYFRERIIVARDSARLPPVTSLDGFRTVRVGVAVASLADDYLMNAMDGALAPKVVHYRDLEEAAAALASGEVAAVVGEAAELEAALGQRRTHYALGPAPELDRRTWDIGAAVRREDAALARAIDSVMSELRGNGVVQQLFSRRGLSYSPPASRSPLPTE